MEALLGLMRISAFPAAVASTLLREISTVAGRGDGLLAQLLLSPLLLAVFAHALCLGIVGPAARLCAVLPIISSLPQMPGKRLLQLQ